MGPVSPCDIDLFVGLELDTYTRLQEGNWQCIRMNNGVAVPSTLDDYLRKRLKPVEGVIPQLAGIEMFGNSIPAANADGDLFEYINFQQRYNIDARIRRANKLAMQYLEPLPEGSGRSKRCRRALAVVESQAGIYAG